MAIEHVEPKDIEKRSFEIISEELAAKGKALPLEYQHIIKRCIHTSADFDYADTMYFGEGVVEKIEDAIKNGCTIVTDTNMAMAGINKSRLSNCGSDVMCFISQEKVAEEARERGVTRSYVSMEWAILLEKPVIFAVGNAPTALLSIMDLVKKEKINPVAVIGVPVGFVNVVESKELLIESGIPCIVNRGRKGGSNIAACIVNAILYNMK